MSTNRTDQLKEENVAKEASNISSQQNAKNSHKDGPPKQSEIDKKARLKITKKKFAGYMGVAISSAFGSKRIIAQCAFETIDDITSDRNIGKEHVRDAALAIDYVFNNAISDIIKDALIEKDFDADDFVVVLRGALNQLVTNVIVEIISKFIDDQDYLCGFLALNVFEDIYRIVAKSVNQATNEVYGMAEEDDSYHDHVVVGGYVFYHDHYFFDKFQDEYFNYYNMEILTPETILKNGDYDSYYETNEYDEESADEEDDDNYTDTDEEDEDNYDDDGEEEEENEAADHDASIKSKKKDDGKKDTVSVAADALSAFGISNSQDNLTVRNLCKQ